MLCTKVWPVNHRKGVLHPRYSANVLSTWRFCWDILVMKGIRNQTRKLQFHKWNKKVFKETFVFERKKFDFIQNSLFNSAYFQHLCGMLHSFWRNSICEILFFDIHSGYWKWGLHYSIFSWLNSPQWTRIIWDWNVKRFYSLFLYDDRLDQSPILCEISQFD